ARFIESDSEVYLKNVESLVSVRSPTVREGQLANDALPNGRASDTAWIGLAPHSVRAVPLDYLRRVIDYANLHNLKVHMHVADQPAEVSACIEEYGRTQIDLLEDARELEYHLRLQKLERAVLSATALFDCATINGARSIGAPGGALERGMPADFFTVDLDDPSIAGASQDDLLASTVFTLSRTAVREVVVGGKAIVSEGQHLIQEEVVERF